MVLTEGPIAFQVRGVTFEGRKEKLLELLDGKTSRKFAAKLIPEPENKYDKYAVAVHVCKPKKPSTHIGYVPKELSKKVSYGIEKELIPSSGHEVLVSYYREEDVISATLKLLWREK